MKGKLSLEIAPTNRSACCNCGKFIDKGSYRIVEKYLTRFTVKDKYCVGCGKILIQGTIGELFEMLKEMEEGMKKKILESGNENS